MIIIKLKFEKYYTGNIKLILVNDDYTETELTAITKKQLRENEVAVKKEHELYLLENRIAEPTGETVGYERYPIYRLL